MAFEQPTDQPNYYPKFSIGDVVILNGSSNGPLMTVKNFEYGLGRNDHNKLGMMFNGHITCTWFDVTNTIKQQEFHQEMLHLAQTNDFNTISESKANTAPTTLIVKTT
jgi:uncharacterized protein YodC (DUF2158 family)